MSGQQETQHFLIVDDDASIVELLSEHLGYKNYSFRTASNGVDALVWLEKEAFTIVITDLIMPEMDGMALMRKIKDKWPETDIITVTGYKRDFTYTDVIKAGASDFIAKPFNLNELDAKINRIVRERELRNMLMSLSIKDGLTELYNRRFFEDRLSEEIIRSRRQGYPLYLIMVDLDNFKRVNDEEGHQTGDIVLKNLASTLKSSTRQHVDIICRFGGDEFAVIVPQANDQQVMLIAERMCVNYLETDRRGTTLSIGIACADQTDSESDKVFNKLIKEADEAMYQAKRAGGNKIQVHKNVLRNMLLDREK